MTHSCIIDKLAQHQTHDLHRHTRTSMFQHLPIAMSTL